MPAPNSFDPDAVAWFEAEGWRAYYDRNLVRGFALMVRLVHSQFGLAWPQALRAALDIVRAYLAFQPVDGDLFETRRRLEAFYHRAQAGAWRAYDPHRVAQRELEYWIVHRVTAGDANREPLTRALAELHAALFGAAVEAMRYSAECRERAAQAVDRITSRRSESPQRDWAIVHAELRACYRDIQRRLLAAA